MLFFKPEVLIPLLIAMLMSLTLHEWAHAWTAYMLGDNTAYHEGRVTLNPIAHLDPIGSLCFILSGGFGWAKPVPVNSNRFKNPRRDDTLVTAAGPISNILLGTVSGIAYYALIKNGYFIKPSSSLVRLGGEVLQMLVTVNFVLAFFNLIPLFPLDGSHIATNLMPLNQAYQFKRFNQSYGPMVLMGLLVLGMMNLPLPNGATFDPLGWMIWPPAKFCIQMVAKFAFWIF